MNENITLIRRVRIPPPSIAEIAKYARSSVEDSVTRSLAEKCIKELAGRDEFSVSYRIMPIVVDEASVDTPVGRIESYALAKVLNGCTRVVLFAMTAGVEYDIYIAKYAKISPSLAHLASALGSERAEAIADAFCSEIESELSREGWGITPRFSPGYADLSLDLQTRIFEVLSPQRTVGVYLNASLLMTPSKSVTAIIGVKEK